MEKSDFIKWARKLENTYVANNRVQEELSHVELIAIVGPTGVGKTSIIKRLGLPEVISDVTRDVREGEKSGRDYRFRNDYLQILQEIKSGEYVQFLISSTDEFYGTQRRAYPNEGTCAMAVYADQIEHFKTLGFHRVRQFFIMPQGYIEWMRRVGMHQSHDLQRRLEEAKKSMQLALADDSYTFILNDDIDFAVREIKEVLNGNEIDQHREGLARATAGSLLEKLGADDDFFEE
jgi:guanylate kinase